MSIMFRAVVLLCLLCVTALLAAFQHSEPDLWFHLSFGRHIAAERVIPAEDPFVYSEPRTGAAWIRMHWLWDLVMYRLHECVGMEGLALLKVLMIAGIFGGALAVSGAGSWAMAMAPLAVFLTSGRFHQRPELVTWALLAVFVAVLERERGRPTRWLWTLPVFVALWVNMHIYFVLSWVLLAAYLVEALAERRPATRLLTAFGLCVGASLLNPSFVEGALLPAQFLVEIIRKGALHLTVIAEQRPLLLTEDFYASGSWWPYWTLVGLAVVGWWTTRPRRVAHGLFLGFVIAFSFLAVRNMPLLALGALAMAPRRALYGRRAAVVRWWKRLPRRGRRAGSIAASVAVLLCAAGFAWQVTTGEWYVSRGYLRRFGLGVEASVIPQRAVTWLEAQPRNGRMFVDFNSAGYLIWRRPDWPVFFHGCADFRNPRFVEYLKFMSAPDRDADFLDRHDVEYVLVTHAVQDASALIHWLSTSSEWKLVYLDEQACVFARHDAPPPAIDEASEDLETVQVSASRPHDWMWGALFRGRALGMLGWEERGVRVLQHAVERFPNSAILWRYLGFLQGRMQRFEDAASAYARSFALNPNDRFVCYNLGLLLHAQQQPGALECMRRAVRLDPNFAQAHYQLGLMYLQGDPARRTLSKRHFTKARRLGLQIPDWTAQQADFSSSHGETVE